MTLSDSTRLQCFLSPLLGHSDVKRKIYKKLNEPQAYLTSQPTVRKAQSTNELARHEESKGGVRRSSEFFEPPPKDCNQRIERLLTKLENASKSTDFEEAARELRYIEEFELISDNYYYNDDQIKRALIVSNPLPLALGLLQLGD